MSTIVITYDGVDISDHVLFETATFEAQLGAFPGSFEFTVKDLDQSSEFTVGKEVTLSINGSKYYGGYVMQVTRQFAFPVVDTVTDGPNSVTARQWVLRGVDYNILFDKRVIYNKDNPERLIPNFTGGTTDEVILQTVMSDYLDLSDDGLDTTTYVTSVGDATPDNEDGDYVNPGSSWRKQMDDIAQFTGAIYYIDADKNVHYQELEDVSPAWSFSDTPDHVTTFGFRDFEFIDDATNVVNDALVWGGSPYGSTGVTAKTVFAQTTNTVSVADVGRWQYAEKHFGETGYFKASGCSIRGKVIVYGDPGAAGPGLGDQSRGLQNPQKNIRLTWFSHQVPTPLVAGSVVTTTLSVWDEVVVLPIRSIRITFPVNYEAQFEGFLGIQTSDPWTLWKYLKKVYTNPPAAPTLPPVSDGSDDTVPPGTQVGTTNVSPSPDGATLVFRIPYGYLENSTRVFKNGLLQSLSIDYSESNPDDGEITFVVAPQSGDIINVLYVSSSTTTAPPSADAPTPDPGFTTIQNAVNAASPGDSFSVPAGTYHETVTVNKALTIYAYGAVVIDGQNSRQYGFDITANDVQLVGFEVTNHRPPYQLGAVRSWLVSRSTFRNLYVHDNPGPGNYASDIGGGISFSGGGGHLIEDCVITDNDIAGVSANGYGVGTTGGIQGLTVRRCTISNNNPSGQYLGWHSGGIKVTKVNNWLIENCIVSGNNGDGIWGDIDVTNSTIRNNRVDHNTYAGIHYEISDSGTISGNVIWECGWGRTDGWAFGAGLQISSSRTVSASNNIVAWCNRSVSVIAQNRGGFPSSAAGSYDHIFLSNNTVINNSGTWMSAWVDDRGSALFSASGNAGSNGRYWANTGEPTSDRFNWSGSKSTIAAYNATPGEEGGAYLSTSEKVAVLSTNGIPATGEH